MPKIHNPLTRLHCAIATWNKCVFHFSLFTFRSCLGDPISDTPLETSGVWTGSLRGASLLAGPMKPTPARPGESTQMKTSHGVTQYGDWLGGELLIRCKRCTRSLSISISISISLSVALSVDSAAPPHPKFMCQNTILQTPLYFAPVFHAGLLRRALEGVRRCVWMPLSDAQRARTACLSHRLPTRRSQYARLRRCIRWSVACSRALSRETFLLKCISKGCRRCRRQETHFVAGSNTASDKPLSLDAPTAHSQTR